MMRLILCAFVHVLCEPLFGFCSNSNMVHVFQLFWYLFFIIPLFYYISNSIDIVVVLLDFFFCFVLYLFECTNHMNGLKHR